MGKMKFSGVYGLLFLIISMVFILPLDIGSAFAEDAPASKPASEGKTKDKVKSVCGASFNIRGSLILSTLTLCLPGILEKAEEWKGYKCQKVVCKYDAISNGLDPGFCEKQDGYNTCKYVIGEMFAVFPSGLLKVVKDFVKQLIANPTGVLFGVAVWAARKYMFARCAGKLCTKGDPTLVYGSLVLASIDMAGAYQTLTSIGDNAFSSSGDDYCGQVEEIKKEMEEIVSVRSGN